VYHKTTSSLYDFVFTLDVPDRTFVIVDGEGDLLQLLVSVGLNTDEKFIDQCGIRFRDKYILRKAFEIRTRIAALQHLIVLSEIQHLLGGYDIDRYVSYKNPHDTLVFARIEIISFEDTYFHIFVKKNIDGQHSQRTRGKTHSWPVA
jgi:hypothetical protein